MLNKWTMMISEKNYLLSLQYISVSLSFSGDQHWESGAPRRDEVNICDTKGVLGSHAIPLHSYTASHDDCTLHAGRSRPTRVLFAR